jgi:predicted LPLAT superfamily acyltransferase
MPDAMCGFRVYPVDATLSLVRRLVRGRRMDFDIEVLVKAYWTGISLVPVPVRVRYPEENFSNFDVLRDNVLLGSLQTRLFFGMLARSPRLVFRRRTKFRLPNADHARWASTKERGSYRGIRILATCYRLLGRRICMTAMVPVVFYFFVTGREQRAASRDYLAHLWRSGGLPAPPTVWMSFRHFLSFGEAALDRFAAWMGKVPRAGLKGEGASLALLDAVEKSGRGAFVITAHIGSPEVVRAIACLNRLVPVNVLMHTEHAQMFNRLIRSVSPGSPVRAVAVTEIGIDTAILLSNAIARGEWVVVAGDRSPVTGDERTVEVPFLGEPANFPQGPYILGSLLKAPAYLLFCVRKGRDFHVHFSKFADRIELPRSDRIGAIRQYAAAFAKVLEERLVETPLQWFNFYSFWDSAHAHARNERAIRKVTLRQAGVMSSLAEQRSVAE